MVPGTVMAERATVVVRFPRAGWWQLCAYVPRDAHPAAANAVGGRDVRVGVPLRSARRSRPEFEG
jgi:hypothetical protein